MSETLFTDRNLPAEPAYSVDRNPLPRRVAIVSSQLFYEGLESLLAGMRAEISGSFTAVEQALSACDAVEPPDLIIVVTCSPESVDALIALIPGARRRMPRTGWLLLADQVSPARLRHAMTAGIAGVLMHNISGGVLRCAIELVLLGQSILPNGVTSMLSPPADEPEAVGHHAAGDLPPPAPARLPVRPASASVPGRLSERERQILACLVKGDSNKLIARKLEIADATVKVHVKALLRKMRVSNRTQAAIHALHYLDLSAPAAPAADPPPAASPSGAWSLPAGAEAAAPPPG